MQQEEMIPNVNMIWKNTKIKTPEKMCKTSKAGQIQNMVHNALTSDERSRFLWRTDSVWIWTLLVLIREARA